MAIVPSGKTRVMVAQTYHDTLSEGNGMEYDANRSSNLETDDAMEEEVGANPVSSELGESGLGESGLAESGLGGETSIDIEEEEAPEEIENTNEKTLTNYVYKKLESYGYPGRRLQDFKAKFVRESVSPEGVKDIQVEIPDKKYPNESGVSDTIENEELKAITQEVNSMFGLHFNGAERSEGKWTIKFTSQKAEDPDAGMAGDNLDEVYGTPSKTKSKGNQKVRADSMWRIVEGSTIQEMIKEDKDKYVPELQEIIGD